MGLTRSQDVVALPSSCQRFGVKWKTNKQKLWATKLKRFGLFVNATNWQHRIQSMCRREQGLCALCPGCYSVGCINLSGSSLSCPTCVRNIKPLTRCKVRKGFSLSQGNHWSGLLHSFTARCVLWTVRSSAYFHIVNPCSFRDQRHCHCSWSLGASKEHFSWWGSVCARGAGVQ